MRILHVMAGAETGGAENAFVELCVAQRQDGLDIHAACRPSPRNDILRAAGIPVAELPFGGFFDFSTTPALRRLINELHPDIVVTWMNRAAAKMPKNTGVCWVARLGGYYSLKYYKGVDRFVVNAPDIARWMRDKGIPGEKIAFIPNFAEQDEGATPVSRAAHDTPGDAFLFLALGRLHPNKAFDTLLDALAMVPDAWLWIAGEGPERARLVARCGARNLDRRVRFLGWRDDRWSLLATCDAVVFPSRHEPFGNTFMQAWAAGRPLVTTASQGPSHYVRDGVDALVTPVDDVPALAEAMKRLMADPALAASLGAAGRDRYRHVFDKQSIIGQWRGFFLNCVSKEKLNQNAI